MSAGVYFELASSLWFNIYSAYSALQNDANSQTFTKMNNSGNISLKQYGKNYNF